MAVRDFNWPAFRELTFGTGGVGKTTAFVQRLRRQRAKIVFIYDHKHEFCQKLGQVSVYTLDGLVRLTDKIAGTKEASGVICFDPTEMFTGAKAEGFAWFCNFVFNVSELFWGRKLLVADELQKLHNRLSQPKELIECLDDGRCRQLDFMGICHGANQIFNGIRAQITEAYVFRQSEKNAVAVLEGDYGFDAAEVRNLRPGEWLWRNLNTGATTQGGKAFQIKSPGMPSAGVAR